MPVQKKSGILLNIYIYIYILLFHIVKNKVWIIGETTYVDQSSLKHSIRFIDIFSNLKQNFMAYHKAQGLDYRDSEDLSGCPSWSNSLWQGWVCGLVPCPGGNTTYPISRVLASSDGISPELPWNLNIITLTLGPINSGVLTSLLLPPLSLPQTDYLPSLNLWCHSKTDARFMQDGWKAVWSIPYVSLTFFSNLKQNFMAYRSTKVSSRPDCIFEIHQLWQSGFNKVYSNCICSCSFEPEIKKKMVCHLIRCMTITYWIFKSLWQF